MPCDPGIVGCHDLHAAGRRRHGPAAQVHLVAVVPGGVVAGGDHDAGLAAQMPDGKRQHGGGKRRGQQESFNTGSRKNGCRFLRKHARVVTGIETDDGARTVRPGVVRGSQIKQMRGHPGCGTAHHGTVHAVGAGAHGGAQPRRAELEPAAEAVPQLCSRRGIRGGLGHQFTQLCGHFRLGVRAGPLQGDLGQRRGLEGRVCC